MLARTAGKEKKKNACPQHSTSPGISVQYQFARNRRYVKERTLKERLTREYTTQFLKGAYQEKSQHDESHMSSL